MGPPPREVVPGAGGDPSVGGAPPWQVIEWRWRRVEVGRHGWLGG